MASPLRELITTFIHCSATEAIVLLICATVKETAAPRLFLAVVVIAFIDLSPIAQILTLSLLSTALLVGLSQLRRHDQVVLISSFWLLFFLCMIVASL